MHNGSMACLRTLVWTVIDECTIGNYVVHEWNAHDKWWGSHLKVSSSVLRDRANI